MDNTPLFLTLVNELQQKSAARKDASSPAPVSIPKRPKPSLDPFLSQGYEIFREIQSLRAFLIKIKPVYLDAYRHLNSSSTTNTSLWTADSAMQSSTTPSSILLSIQKSVEGLKSLTDDQRNQVDLATRTFVESLLKRIRILETAASKTEQNQKDLNGGNAQGFLAKLGFLDLVSGGLAASRAHEAFLSEHRKSVIWFLQKRLMQASEDAQHMQKAWFDLKQSKQLTFEIKRVQELPTAEKASGLSGMMSSSPLTTGASLIANVGRGVVGAVTAAAGINRASAVAGWDSDDDDTEEKDGTTIAGPNSSNGNPSFRSPTQYTHQVPDKDDSDEDEDILSAFPEQQRLLLEREHEQLTLQFQSGLEQVRNATQSLQEISSLHEQLAFHLQEQEKTIHRLHEEAVVATHNIETGNVYLRKAYKNFGDSRLWLIVFFFVSTFSLLFLDWFNS
ncbi:hypothetical protein HDU97_001156 [Phlyctochytrium planicorne]|nr:hypothetical protein HDU97_001156 [Phlyctochytrium planicorne]